jgi:hypothetical protein
MTILNKTAEHMTHTASVGRKEGMIRLEVYPSQLMPKSPQ